MVLPEALKENPEVPVVDVAGVPPNENPVLPAPDVLEFPKVNPDIFKELLVSYAGLLK